MESLDDYFLSRTLKLALKGSGMVSPNPMVGSVLVKEGKIISEGFHHKYGGVHAEVDAINNASEDVSGAEMYVSLEPCSHFGKTPPCADLIIDKKIRRVVIGSIDPNPIVAGNGIKKLLDAGISVEVSGNKKYPEFYQKFATYMTTDFPWVTIKSAITLDGNVAETSGYSKWITSDKSRKVVQQLRKSHDAVLTTSKTVKIDNPRLALHKKSDLAPKRIMLTSKLFFDDQLNFFQNTDGKSMIFTSDDDPHNYNIAKRLDIAGIPVIVTPQRDEQNHPDPIEVFKKIKTAGITSVLVESGAEFVSALLNKKLFNEFILFVAPKLIGHGINLFSGINQFGLDNSMKLNLRTVKKTDKDAILYFERMVN
ncbi:MAG: bifunctional diaminohydroxyphosphoribosylaminopyrimidine deaminase/5-amino-6-(5-phosphoribosylamino)uracil reductase RibD [Ignavibacteriales bacterium]|nr:bifunctional diaminohydroxyphosphoribosylaminopyrimidine deaminase/5-amino-6-(5-phosphoribosylamino)uracil reductase RibD [Ignavibacteriales bacterium]